MYIRQSALCGLTAHIRGRCVQAKKELLKSKSTRQKNKISKS